MKYQLLAAVCSCAGFAGLAGEINWHVYVSIALIYVATISYATGESS